MSTNPSANQINALLTFLEEHQELARGHLKTAEGRTRSRHLWARLTDELNALGGCMKTTKQWQKVWADKKYLTKKAAAAARRSACATGGGPSTAGELSAQELRITSMMGAGYGEPESDARVPAFPQIPASPLGGLQDIEVVSLAIPELAHQDELPQQQQQGAPENPARSSSIAARRRRRLLDTRGPEPSVRQRLFAIEERRVAAEVRQTEELSRIRATLQELCTVVQAHLQEIVNELRTWRQ